MPRIARLVVPGFPHHVTQRGSRRQRTFFSDTDYQTYLMLLAEAKERAGVAVWAYCLMPNHVHLVVVPNHPDSLADFFKESHRRYTRMINIRNEWQGHLWQERFRSFVMDECHLMSAVRYVEQNPLRAGLCDDPCDWPWSSAAAHLKGRDDLLVEVAPMLTRVSDWAHYLGSDEAEDNCEAIRHHSSSGRPAGNDLFLNTISTVTGRDLRTARPGRRKGF